MQKQFRQFAVAIGFSLLAAGACRAGDKPPDKHAPKVNKNDEAARAVMAQLMSTTPTEVDAGVAEVRATFAKDWSAGGHYLYDLWAKPLLVAKRYEDLAGLSLTGMIASADSLSRLEGLAAFRVRALLKLDRGEDALAAAKSLYNVCSMKTTSRAIDLVAEALKVARKDDPDIAKKFRLQQLQGANTNATEAAAAAATNGPPILAGVKVDPAPYVHYAEKMRASGKINYQSLCYMGNLYLLADQPANAKEVFEQASEWEGEGNPGALENMARTMLAQDGAVGRANAWILSLRDKM